MLMATVSGKLIDLETLQPQDINVYDIAWALSNTNRYGGQSIIPWDVLSHTGLVYMLYIQHDVANASNLKTILALMLHDAAEAYIGDIISPIKHTSAGAGFQKLEESILYTIITRFGLKWDEVDWAMIERYDKQAGYVEMKRLFPGLFNDSRRKDGWCLEPQYHMSRDPGWIRAKVPDFVQLLRDLAINNNVPDIQALFELPDTLGAHLQGEATKPATSNVDSMTIEIRETRDVEDMTIR